MIIRKENNKIYVHMDYFTMPTKTQFLISKSREEFIKKNNEYREATLETGEKITVYVAYDNMSLFDYIKAYEIELDITDNNKLKNKKKLIKMYGEKNIKDVEHALNSLI